MLPFWSVAAGGGVIIVYISRKSPPGGTVSYREDSERNPSWILDTAKEAVILAWTDAGLAVDL
jgi:hypothetical protein